MLLEEDQVSYQQDVVYNITYISVDYNITVTYPLLIDEGGTSMTGLSWTAGCGSDEDGLD